MSTPSTSSPRWMYLGLPADEKHTRTTVQPFRLKILVRSTFFIASCWKVLHGYASDTAVCAVASQQEGCGLCVRGFSLGSLTSSQIPKTCMWGPSRNSVVYTKPIFYEADFSKLSVTWMDGWRAMDEWMESDGWMGGERHGRAKQMSGWKQDKAKGFSVSPDLTTSTTFIWCAYECSNNFEMPNGHDLEPQHNWLNSN